MNRGSAVALATLVERESGFNEAPIHESGKSWITGYRWSTTSGFNEAPIHESGKYYQGGRGPRRSGRFNEAPIHESGKCSRLYCSATYSGGFNEAPIHESGKCRCQRRAVTLGHDASMRPRFMNRGSAPLGGHLVQQCLASMRPRFMNRGSHDPI